MTSHVILLPRELSPSDVAERTVVVFDVLRATTTMTAALAAGVREIRVFDGVEAAREAAAGFPGQKVLAGEVNTLPPPGFDLGNSPGDFRRDLHAGRTAFMATTNGTRAVVAARGAALLFVGALVNAQAVARAVARAKRDVTLLCSGTQGMPSLEDLLGAGAVLDALAATKGAAPAGDLAHAALRLFRASRHDLPEVLREGNGGRNVIHAGLEPDIDFCAQLDALTVVGVVHDNPLSIHPIDP